MKTLSEMVDQVLTRFELSGESSVTELKNYKFAFDTLLDEDKDHNSDVCYYIKNCGSCGHAWYRRNQAFCSNPKSPKHQQANTCFETCDCFEFGSGTHKN